MSTVPLRRAPPFHPPGTALHPVQPCSALTGPTEWMPGGPWPPEGAFLAFPSHFSVLPGGATRPGTGHVTMHGPTPPPCTSQLPGYMPAGHKAVSELTGRDLGSVHWPDSSVLPGEGVGLDTRTDFGALLNKRDQHLNGAAQCVHREAASAVEASPDLDKAWADYTSGGRL